MGFDNDGQTPIQLLITTKSLGIVFDFSKKRTVASFTTSDRSLISSIWSTISSDKFFIGDSNNNVTCFQITDESSYKVLWSSELHFSPDFFAISPFDSDSLLVAASLGDFKILSAQTGGTINLGGKFPINDNPLKQVRYYPFLNNTLLFVSSTGVNIYTLSDRALVKVIGSDMGHERIFDIAFDESNETIFALIHGTHFRKYEVTSNGLIRRHHIQYISHPKSSIRSYIVQSHYKNKIAVLSLGGFLQIFEFVDHDIVPCCVHKMLPSKPLDFDVYNNSLITGSVYGYISITRDSHISNFFHLYEGRIARIVWLNQDKFVAIVVAANNATKAFFYDIPSMKAFSLLRSAFNFYESSIDIIVSKNRKYFAIVISGYIVLVFKDTNNFATILEQTQVLATFSDICEEEIIIITSKWVGKKYLLSPDNSSESYHLLTKVDFNIIKINEYPTVVKALNDHLICGTNHGDIIVIDWSDKNLTIPFLKKQISSIEIYENNIFVVDVANSVGLIKFDNERYNVKFVNDEKCLKSIKWINGRQILAKKPSQPSLTVLSADSLTPLSRSKEINVLSKEEFMKQLKETSKDLFSICQLASHSGYNLLAILLRSLSPTRFAPNCFCANFTVDRIRSFLDVINGMLALTSSSHQVLRIRKARLEILLGNNEKAMNLFLASPPNSSNYVIDAIKVAYFNTKDSEHAIAPSVAALIDSNKISDATDILIITEQYKEAAKLLTTTGNVEEVFEIAKTKMDDNDIGAILDSLVRTLLAGNHFLQAASIMVACKKIKEAAEIMRSNGFGFVADVLQSVKCTQKGIEFEFN
ncbi:hypothetical protein GPJ56_006793 [Histomonas meleagridis]|uniref:uncharacterized protein n=1 Tax=Histomonas meleagridis TaxID=135588 RepID=UPI00355A56EA|nr:hypothetical protein GPJ56_006793 [Histomonas meleagridis]KAH0800202.1 hypothetical protein GO595_007314 [Histomonas meleagridis]